MWNLSVERGAKFGSYRETTVRVIEERLIGKQMCNESVERDSIIGLQRSDYSGSIGVTNRLTDE